MAHYSQVTGRAISADEAAHFFARFEDFAAELYTHPLHSISKGSHGNLSPPITVISDEVHSQLRSLVDNRLDWKRNSNSVFKSLQSRLFFLRKLMPFAGHCCMCFIRVF